MQKCKHCGNIVKIYLYRPYEKEAYEKGHKKDCFTKTGSASK